MTINALSNEARREQSRMERKNRADDQLELKDVMDALSKRDGEIKAFAEKASQEIKDHGKILDETKAVLEGLSKSGLALQDRLQEVEQKLARRFSANDPAGAKSLGEQFCELDGFKSMSDNQRGTTRMRVKAVTNITSATTGTGGVGVAIQPDRQAGIITAPDRQFMVRDLIMPGRTASNSIEYVRESGYQKMAAAVAEGAAKPQSDLSFELKTTTVKTIAHWFRASKQVL
ncbi:phage major capsid protein, partial [Metapseudomonas otitidis]|uniref:phage major capsid protein n=1 Tax=Metapseudomonas otitidis TaxID=319939 RepID=UPI00209AFE12